MEWSENGRSGSSVAEGCICHFYYRELTAITMPGSQAVWILYAGKNLDWNKSGMAGKICDIDITGSLRCYDKI